MQVLDGLPENNVTEEFVLAMAATVQEHNCVSGSTDSMVLFVVQPDEKNSFDQQVSHLLTHVLHLACQLKPLCWLVVVVFCMSLSFFARLHAHVASLATD